MKKTKKPRSRAFNHFLAVLLTAVIWAAADYFLLLPYNVQSQETWYMAAVLLILFGVLDILLNFGNKDRPEVEVETDTEKFKYSKWGRKAPSLKKYFSAWQKTTGVRAILIAVLLVVVCTVLVFFSSPVFNAKKYASIAGEGIETRDFIADTPQSESIDDIALMDTESARIIGSRALGSLSELVSQFEISNVYTQINLNGKPMKVTPLEYASFFKYLANKSEGIPGYIMVDPVSNTSEYVELEQPMYYSDSSYFSKYLYRQLRFNYRTAMFGDIYFEIADDGTPYYVAPVLKHSILLFGGTDTKGVVTLNPCTGETVYYDVGDVPQWIDIVYDGDALAQRYDWYGIYSNGFLNSVLSNKDCKRVTDDYGYKMFDDDVWVFTGVTSVVSDESNIGFVLMNSRTAEIRYYAIPGAEEYSVMRSAEGEVQNLGYTASFPSVINIDGQPTYIMVLKDKGGLVKQYALIHVERYNIVTTATTQKEAIAKYQAALAANGVTADGTKAESETKDFSITVREIKYLVQEGNSIAYIISNDGDIFRMNCSIDERIVLVKAGDELKLFASEESSGIYSIYSFEFASDSADSNNDGNDAGNEDSESGDGENSEQ